MVGYCFCISLLNMFITGNGSQRNIKYSLESGFSRPAACSVNHQFSSYLHISGHISASEGN